MRLWDADTGEPLRIYALWRTWRSEGREEDGHAVWDLRTNEVLHAGGDAWRWLRWVATDADGWPDPLPLETSINGDATPTR